MDKTAEKFLDFFTSIDELIFCLLLLLLPFGWAASILPLGLFIALQIISVFKNGVLPDKKKITYFSPLVIYFVWELVSLLWTSNIENGLRIISQQISLLLIPLTYLFLKPDVDLIRKGIRFFISGIILSSLVLLTKAFLHSISMDGLKIVFDTEFAGDTLSILDSSVKGNYYNGVHFSVFMHPSYFGLMICTAALYFIWGLIPGSLFTVNMKFANSSMIFFAIILIFLATNALIINLLFLLLLWLFVSIKFIDHHNWERVLAIIFGLIFVFALYVAPQTQELLQGNTTTLDNKLELSKLTIDAIKSNFWFGTGVGSEQEAMNALLKPEQSTLVGKNPHNQFLQTWLSLGFFGFLILMWAIANILYTGIKHHIFLMVGFAFEIIIAFSFESMLHRYWGIAFFSLFYSFIYFYHDRDKNENKIIRVKFKKNKLERI